MEAPNTGFRHQKSRSHVPFIPKQDHCTCGCCFSGLRACGSPDASVGSPAMKTTDCGCFGVCQGARRRVVSAFRLNAQLGRKLFKALLKGGKMKNIRRRNEGFSYDALSYAQNFDEGCWKDQQFYLQQLRLSLENQRFLASTAGGGIKS
eukprot:TRINITY_DN31733_c0_g1_i1.p1 TRINITY_DN31733_c0_g1~~TRINITY_DN31733_c0_g1_i1.p1  ORF type:complete len:149 (+),score=11.50 TRINITY_DN31733_c0_g1_i1:134-580(+)